MEALLQAKAESQGVEVEFNKKQELPLQNAVAKKQNSSFAAKVFYFISLVFRPIFWRPRLVRYIEPGRFEVVEENYLPVSTKF